MSFAIYINDRGQVLIRSRTADDRSRTFFWDRGVLLELDQNLQTFGINNRGQAYANFLVDGVVGAHLLTFESAPPHAGGS